MSACGCGSIECHECGASPPESAKIRTAVRAMLSESGLPTTGGHADAIEASLKKLAKVDAESSSPPSEVDPLALMYSDIHWDMATAIGFNELARTAVTLGEKAYFVAARKSVVEKLGPNYVTFTEAEEPVVTVHVGLERMKVDFYPRDIELMRAAVAAHDAKKEGSR